MLGLPPGESGPRENMAEPHSRPPSIPLWHSGDSRHGLRPHQGPDHHTATTRPQGMNQPQRRARSLGSGFEGSLGPQTPVWKARGDQAALVTSGRSQPGWPLARGTALRPASIQMCNPGSLHPGSCLSRAGHQAGVGSTSRDAPVPGTGQAVWPPGRPTPGPGKKRRPKGRTRGSVPSGKARRAPDRQLETPDPSPLPALHTSVPSLAPVFPSED